MSHINSEDVVWSETEAKLITSAGTGLHFPTGLRFSSHCQWQGEGEATGGGKRRKKGRGGRRGCRAGRELTASRCQKQPLHLQRSLLVALVLWSSEVLLVLWDVLLMEARSYMSWGKDEVLAQGAVGFSGDVGLALPLATATYVPPGKICKHGV